MDLRIRQVRFIGSLQSQPCALDVGSTRLTVHVQVTHVWTGVVSNQSFCVKCLSSDCVALQYLSLVRWGLSFIDLTMMPMCPGACNRHVSSFNNSTLQNMHPYVCIKCPWAAAAAWCPVCNNPSDMALASCVRRIDGALRPLCTPVKATHRPHPLLRHYC